MRCPSCHFENPEGMNFCGKCATPLHPCCPQCGFENPPGFAFCGKCATPLTSVSSSQSLTPSIQPPTVVSSQFSAHNPPPPVSYTPAHLAERIRAVSLA